MQPLRGLSWAGTCYAVLVIVAGAALLPVSLVFFPIRGQSELLELVYLGVLMQVTTFMPIRGRHGSQVLDMMQLVAASILAPGAGPALLGWLCKFDGRLPSADVPLWKLLFNRGRTAIEFGIPSVALAMVPLPPEINVPVKAVGFALGTLLIGYPLTAKAFALTERVPFWSVVSANIGLHSVRSVLILSAGGGVLYMVLQFPGGYVMGLGLLGLLVAVRSNMADAQRQQIERIQTLELLAQALDARDPMTELHSQRVSTLAVKLAQVLGMSDLDVERIRVAGLLHDIGKIGVPDSVLKKPSPLDAGEWEAMRRHAEVGAEMIARHSALRPMAPWVKYHHERWNGSGYPMGLSGTAIPLGARILAVADSFDTITGPRVYRPTSMSASEAVEDVTSGAGVLYDPVVVNCLRQLHQLPPCRLPGDTDDAAESGAIELIHTNARFRSLAAGIAVSSLGDPLTTVAVTLSAFAVTHNGLGVGAAMVLRAGATMLSGMLLGGAADRLPRRHLIVASDVTQFAALAALPALLALAPWTLFAAVIVLGIAGALGQAGRDASIPHLVGTPRLGSANSVIAVGTNIGRSIGYPLAGVLVWIGSSTTPLYILDSTTFVAAAALTLLAGPLGGGIKSRTIMGAFRSTFSLPSLRPTLAVAAAGAFLLSMTIPAVIVIAFQLTPYGARAYTVLEVAITAGMVAGSVVFASFARQQHGAMLAGIALMGALSVLTAASPYFVLTLGLLLIASIGNQLYFIGNRTQLQQLAPGDRVGSVMATRGVIVQTLAILGSGVGGVLTAAVGGRMTYGIAGAGLLLLAGAVVLFSRPPRRAPSPALDQGVGGGIGAEAVETA